MTGTPIISEIVGGSMKEGDTGISKEIYTSQIAGGVRVVDGEDAGFQYGVESIIRACNIYPKVRGI